MFTFPHLFKDGECQGRLVEFERDENWVLCTCDRCAADVAFDRNFLKEARRGRVDVDARTQSRHDEAPF